MQIINKESVRFFVPSPDNRTDRNNIISVPKGKELIMGVRFDDDNYNEYWEKCTKEAEKIIEDEDKLERLLQRCEKKLQLIPVGGGILSMIPTLISLVRSYVKKEYKDIPIGTIISIVAVIIYFVSPIDIIPDAIPVAGYIDDAAVVGVALKFLQSDVDEYRKWRKDNGKEIEDI